MADLQGWSRETWSSGSFGEQAPVNATGVEFSASTGTLSQISDVVIVCTPVTLSLAIGDYTAEGINIFPLTGVQSVNTFLGTPTIEEGHAVEVTSLSMTFTEGEEASSGSVDAGWGRSTWGSFAWNENIEIFANVTGVQMVSSLADVSVSVGTGVIVSTTGLPINSTLDSVTLETDQIIEPDSLSIGVALSGATVSAEGSVAVIAPTDQMDFQLGTVLAEAQSIVDLNPVVINTSLGSVDIEIISVIEPTAVTLTTTLDNVTVSVGTGVIVSATGIGMTFSEASISPTGDALVFPTSLTMTLSLANIYSTPWANVNTNASNTWTGVDTATIAA